MCVNQFIIMRHIILILFLSPTIVLSQTVPCFSFEEEDFVVSGNATILDEDTVLLTQAVGNQAGFVWSQNLVNFELNFSLEAELYLGTQDFGADGIAFVIQALSNNEGSLGGGIGYAGISPSLAIEFDTWWNSRYDPTQEDHVALIANGEPMVLSAHSNYIPYAGVGNLEDGQWHPIMINWDGTDKILSLSLDGESIFSTTLDIPALFFDGDPNLYWGFTAATGGANNLHQVRILEYCSFDSSCDTVAPTAPSPQNFCESVRLEDLQVSGTAVRFYSDTIGTELDPNTLITENSSIYITQTIDDCESIDLAIVDINIQIPNIDTNPFQILFCNNTDPLANLFEASELFTYPPFAGFFNSNTDAENLTNLITNPEVFSVSNENQIVYARVENDICYDIYTIILIPKNCDIIIPQGFSPNDDGFNDFFNIQNLYDIHLNHSLKIYNRYGICVFEGNNSSKWKGYSDGYQLVPVGTYFYVLSLNNETEDTYTGWVYCNY